MKAAGFLVLFTRERDRERERSFRFQKRDGTNWKRESSRVFFLCVLCVFS